MLHEQLACTGQSRAARGAYKKLHAKIFFQFLDRSGQWRLLDMQLLGCTSEMEFFCYGQETSQVAQLDNEPSQVLARFIERVSNLESPSAKKPTVLFDLDTSEK